jgi:amino acid adenylation domain-containing protein
VKVAVDLLAAFIRSSERHPHRIAARTPSGSVTYAELRRRSMSLAATLDRRAPADPPLTCSLGGRTPTAYAGILAALYRGHGYLPLSTSHPAARNAEVLSRTGCAAIVADELGARQLIELVGRLEQRPTLVVPDLVDPTELREHASGCAVIGGDELESGEAAVDRETEAASLAYLLFTSGSTGSPKGVPISHANARSFLDAASRRYGIGPSDRLSQTFDQVFDLSVFDLFVAWSGGARVCSPRPIDLLSPFRYVEQHGITLWFSVPSLATLLRRKRLLRPGSLPSLRWSLFCGEALARSTAEAWQAAAPGSTLENLYGPTEATIACTAYRWDPERSPGECVDGLVPIGHPFDGVQTVVLDESLEPVDDDRPGELCVGGAQTFDGYWRDPAATERAFVERRGVRSYRTGDRVRALPGPGLAFVGRLDHQVQVMGHRVELGEVEAALRTADGVVEAVALPQGGAAGSAEGIVAFVTGTPDPEAALRHVRTRLPGHAVPRAIHILDALPLNPNGKVDRGALRRSADEEEAGRKAGP